MEISAEHKERMSYLISSDIILKARSIHLQKNIGTVVNSIDLHLVSNDCVENIVQVNNLFKLLNNLQSSFVSNDNLMKMASGTNEEFKKMLWDSSPQFTKAEVKALWNEEYERHIDEYAKDKEKNEY